MTNLVLFVVTVVGYYLVGLYFYKEFEASNGSKYPSKKALAICALLALPVNINGNIYTIAGNARAEKGMYSIASIYQRADQGDTSAFVFAGYQQAKRDAGVAFGFSGYQQAKRDADIGFGLSLYQRTGRNAGAAISVSMYQQATQEAAVGVGLSVYQRADKFAATYIGLGLYQRVHNKTRTFGAFSPLRADESVSSK